MCERMSSKTRFMRIVRDNVKKIGESIIMMVKKSEVVMRGGVDVLLVLISI